ncbi:hypothetical protein PTKIN_Ptkin09bG0183100 [Pterospermum kingtungense]
MEEVVELTKFKVVGKILAEKVLNRRGVIGVLKSMWSPKEVPRDGRSRIWAKVRYEKVVDFCFYCGRLGHQMKSCEHNETVKSNGEGKRRFGMWMKTGLFRKDRYKVFGKEMRAGKPNFHDGEGAIKGLGSNGFVNRLGREDNGKDVLEVNKSLEKIMMGLDVCFAGERCCG